MHEGEWEELKINLVYDDLFFLQYILSQNVLRGKRNLKYLLEQILGAGHISQRTGE